MAARLKLSIQTPLGVRRTLRLAGEEAEHWIHIRQNVQEAAKLLRARCTQEMLGHIWFVRLMLGTEDPGQYTDPPIYLKATAKHNPRTNQLAQRVTAPRPWEIDALAQESRLISEGGPDAPESVSAGRIDATYRPFDASLALHDLPLEPTVRDLANAAREAAEIRLRHLDWEMRCDLHPSSPLGAAWLTVATGALTKHIHTWQGHGRQFPKGLEDAAWVEEWFQITGYTKYLGAQAALGGKPLRHWPSGRPTMTIEEATQLAHDTGRAASIMRRYRT